MLGPVHLLLAREECVSLQGRVQKSSGGVGMKPRLSQQEKAPQMLEITALTCRCVYRKSLEAELA